MGHVFIVHASLLEVACDAWLVPGGGLPGHTWRPALPPVTTWMSPPPGFGESVRTMLLAEPPAPEPLPFLTDIVGTNRHAPEWYVDGARQFMRAAHGTLVGLDRKPAQGRSRYLLTLPLAGTGGGGGGAVSGEVVRGMLKMLQEQCAELDVDAALVLIDGPAWAAAQHERAVAGDAYFAELPPRLKKVADDLAVRARAGDLVLFLGAGVSVGAGLPSWGTLLMEMATEHAGLDERDRAHLERLGELDRAAVIRRRMHDAASTLPEAVAAHLRARSRRYALSHSLLANLPVDEVITTNYDQLFELASSACERRCTVLPGGQVARGRRWLLKMHGCVSRPESIVLTREDYLKFQENRTALAGIVQALLLTRHMLFVGFSLTDDNFHRIAHAVRSSLSNDGGPQRFGTSLVVGGNPLAEELWRQELSWVTFDGDGTAEQARLLTIFLDRLSMHAASATQHLGDRRYEAVLTPGERALRDRLEGLTDAVDEAERETGAWAEVERALRRLGIQRGRSHAKVPPV